MLRMDTEGFARALRRRAGVGLNSLVLAPSLAERLIGHGCLMLAPGLHASACLSVQGRRHAILIREVGPDTNFDVAHELAHWALRAVWGTQADDTERNANALAAALLAPPGAVRRLYTANGENVASIAETLAISQTATFLRLGEVLRDERAVVTRSGNVLLRSQGAFPWASVPVVDVARGKRWAGLARAHLRGGIDEGRVGLLAR